MGEPPGPYLFEGHLATFTACLGQFVETLSCWGTEGGIGTAAPATTHRHSPTSLRHILNRALVRDALNLDDALARQARTWAGWTITGEGGSCGPNASALASSAAGD